MKLSRTWLSMCALVALAAGAHAGNIVADGDFEGGYAGFNSSWTLVAGFPNNIGVTQGFPPTTFPQAGSWFAFFADGIPIEDHFYQTLATNIGDSYTLTFWVGIQSDDVSDGSTKGTQIYAPQLSVGWTGGGENTLTFPASSATAPYAEYTFNYVATTTSTTLDFAGADSYNTIVALDTVSVVDNGPVPEPAALGLGGAGLLAIGLLRRWRR
jgi:hypothetical protein